jgi:CBS domain-containing protein
VLEVFGRHRELISLPVLENHHPIGLISRNIFMSQMSKPYHRELYEKKSCIAFMDKDPLIVEADTPIETLGALAVESGDKTLADGFLIVNQGKFAGLGSGLELMRMLVALQAEKNRSRCRPNTSSTLALFSSKVMIGTLTASACAVGCCRWRPITGVRLKSVCAWFMPRLKR